MPRRSRKLWHGRTCVSSPSGLASSSTCKPCIGCATVSCIGEPPSSIRSGGFCWSAASPWQNGPLTQQDGIDPGRRRAKHHTTDENAARPRVAGVEAVGDRHHCGQRRSNAFPTKMLAVNGCARSLESGRWFPRPRSRPLAMAQRFVRGASLPLGSDWCRDSTPPGARQALRHQQTRQCVLAPHVHSWRSRCAAASEVRHRRLQWVQQMEARAPCNKVIVAIANKLARIAWAVLFRGVDYRATAKVAAA